MSKASKIILIVVIVALALAVCSPAYADKGGQGKAQAKGQIRHKETGSSPYNGTVDPCEVRGDCGQGDHGQGDPEDRGQGSAHANCRAAQGEVDPICQPEQPPEQPPEVPPEEPPKEPPEEAPPEIIKQPPAVRVCFYSSGNAVEPSNATDAPELIADPVAFEQTVITEGWGVACWDAAHGSTWYVLTWNPETGHAGPVYRVTVGEDASNADLHNPFLYIEVNGVIAERISPAPPGPTL